MFFQAAESLDFVPNWGEKETHIPDCQDKKEVDFVQSSNGKERQEQVRSVVEGKEEKNEEKEAIISIGYVSVLFRFF